MFFFSISGLIENKGKIKGFSVEHFDLTSGVNIEIFLA